jgi:formylglycine-generating enzyme required for sulfatase activity
VTRIEDTPFRLPTEEEWNAAAGSGPYAGGDDPVRVAWFADDSGGHTHPVCEKARTALGFCDLSGNVWEWTLTGSGRSRILRGGGWFDSATFLRLDNTLETSPGNRHAYLGFRLVSPDPGGGVGQL